MRGLNESQLAEAGRKSVRPDKIIWLIVGDVSEVESGVRRLNYDEIVKLDADNHEIK